MRRSEQRKLISKQKKFETNRTKTIKPREHTNECHTPKVKGVASGRKV
jgi:hypothetical protein